MIGGCIVKSYPYQYIQIKDTAEMDGEAHQTSALKKRFKNHRAMPIFYYITRDEYTIYFELDRLSFYPSVFITSKKVNGGLLQLKGGKKLGCGRFDEFKYEDGKQISYESERELRYEWLPEFVCSVEEKSSDRVIIFQILNDQGKVLGEEKIPFTLKANGIYYEVDGI